VLVRVHRAAHRAGGEAHGAVSFFLASASIACLIHDSNSR
jgi:hypothetical protein